jgi:hypothetical protein
LLPGDYSRGCDQLVQGNLVYPCFIHSSWDNHA